MGHSRDFIDSHREDTIRLVLRMLADQAGFFTSREWKWNCFDIFVVLTSVIEMLVDWVKILSSASGESASASSIVSKFTMLRILRLLRIVRTVSSFRLIRFIRELRRMVSSLCESMKSLLWSMVL